MIYLTSPVIYMYTQVLLLSKETRSPKVFCMKRWQRLRWSLLLTPTKTLILLSKMDFGVSSQNKVSPDGWVVREWWVVSRVCECWVVSGWVLIEWWVLSMREWWVLMLSAEYECWVSSDECWMLSVVECWVLSIECTRVLTIECVRVLTIEC